MTWTYSGDPSANNRDAVRFLTGDTNTTDQLVTDEEIAFALSQKGNEIYASSIYVVKAIIAKFARDTDSQIESVRIDASSRVNNLTALLSQLIASAQDEDGMASPLVYGVSVAAMDAADLDTDRPPSAFGKDQFKYPYTNDYADRNN